MTYREIIYSVLDRIKAMSDDADITEEHVAFTADKVRAALLYLKYKDIHKEIPESNYQTLCLDLEVDDANHIACEGMPYLKSTTTIPLLMSLGITNIYPENYFRSNITMVSKERMKYVGSNKLLQNIIYGTILPTGYLYLTSKNPQFLYLRKVRISGIFENAQEAAKLSCDNNECESWDNTFPIEEALVPVLIDTVTKDLLSAYYRPDDVNNDANDNLADIVRWLRTNTKSDLQKQIEL